MADVAKIRLSEVRKTLEAELNRVQDRGRELKTAIELLDKNRQAWGTVRVILRAVGMEVEDDP